MLENYDYSAVIAESVKESSPAPLTVEQLLSQLQQSLTTQEQFAEAETMNFKFDLQTGEIIAEAKDLEGNLVYTKTYEATQAEPVADIQVIVTDVPATEQPIVIPVVASEPS